MTASRDLVVRFWTEVVNAHDPDAARQLMADDYRQHAAGIDQGPDGFVAFLTGVLSTSQGMHATINGLIEIDDLVISTSTVTFIEPPPGWAGSNELVDVFRIRSGRLAEHWDIAPYSTSAAEDPG
jgi:predicted SnoaL-like aldol condensation-catalyzing enzyme